MRANKIQWLAAATPLGDTGGISYDRVVASLNYIVENVLLIAGFIAVGAIVYYGFRMTMSKGDPTKFNEAKGWLIKACIGAAIIFGVYTIIATVQGAARSIGQ
ncbi:MAG: hypothetical protein AAB375_00410 [Patescibacteria group bacterium]